MGKPPATLDLARRGRAEAWVRKIQGRRGVAHGAAAQPRAHSRAASRTPSHQVKLGIEIENGNGE